MTKLLLGALALVLFGCGAAADGGEDGTSETLPAAATPGAEGHDKAEVGTTSEPLIVVDTTGGGGGGCNICPVVFLRCVEYETDSYGYPIRCIRQEPYFKYYCC